MIRYVGKDSIVTKKEIAQVRPQLT